MGEVIVIEHLTLDGVMQAPGRQDEDPRDGFRYGGWAARGQDPVMQQVMGAHMSDTWSLLAGRTTYEQFADHWPAQAPMLGLQARSRASRSPASIVPVCTAPTPS